MSKDNTSYKESVVHSFPGIGIFTKETIKAYEENGLLAKMLTTIILHKDEKLTKLLSYFFPNIISKFKSRNFNEIPKNKISIFPFQEAIRLFSVRFFPLTITDRIWERAELSYDKWAANKLTQTTKIVHAYEHAALATFEKATKLGIVKILEQTSQHYSFYEKLAVNQADKYPGLQSDYNRQISGTLLKKRNLRKQKEHELADFIICNSSFTKKTLIAANINVDKIIVVPLAFPVPIENLRFETDKDKFRFLFVGSLSLRKGTHILLEAWQRNFAKDPSLELILIGKNLLPKSLTTSKSNNIRIIDFLPQKEINTFYDLSDVFVFPTLADGFGMVISEAMSRGLPVISTECSAAPDLINHKKDGLIIKSDDLEDLVEKMTWCLENKNDLRNISIQALAKAQAYQWENYRKKLIQEIRLKLNA